MFKVSNKTQEQQWSGDFIVNFGYISHFFIVVFLLLSLDKSVLASNLTCKLLATLLVNH